jgi:hypothetical protein
MNSPHRYNRQNQAEKHGQAILSNWNNNSMKVIEIGHRKVIENIPAATSESMNTSNKTVIASLQQPLEPKPIHKGHRYLFVFQYEGVQPIHNADSVSSWGRYGTVKQSRFNYHEDKAIVFALPHALKIWIKHPSGNRTAKELAEAHQSAWRVAQSFIHKHGIAITSEKSAGFSEHTIESKPLDNLIRPTVVQEPELAKKELGLSINQTSHKNKVEWTGKPAKERVIVLERILDGHLEERLEKVELGLEKVCSTMDKVVGILERLIPKPNEEGIKPISNEDRGMYR